MNIHQDENGTVAWKHKLYLERVWCFLGLLYSHEESVLLLSKYCDIFTELNLSFLNT